MLLSCYKRMPGGYREFIVHPALIPYVECVWTCDGPAGERAHRILPDLCVDVVHALWSVPSGLSLTRRISGPMTRAVLLESAVKYLGVRFRPGAAGCFLRDDVANFTDRTVDCAGAWFDGLLPADVFVDGPLSRAVELVQRRLLARAANVRSPCPEVGHAMSRWARAPVAISEIAGSLGRSRQHLTRRVRAETGLTPRTILRIQRLMRFRAAWERSGGAGNFADLAFRHGWSDQAHFSRDIRALIGLRPREWLER